MSSAGIDTTTTIAQDNANHAAPVANPGSAAPTQRPNRQNRSRNAASTSLDSETKPGGRSRRGAPNRGRVTRERESRAPSDNTDNVNDVPAASHRPRGRRGRFGSRLTQNRPAQGQLEESQRGQGRSSTPPPNSDLTMRLTHALRTPPYPDCPICFNPLHPSQPTWSCSVTHENTTCCWSTFHLKCVRAWASKSVKDTSEAYASRGEHKEGEWRCPGCQTKRGEVPKAYRCFCGTIMDPKPGISTPHSCGMPCSRPRGSCAHPCTLNCHPGPCPPCVLIVRPQCHCSKTTLPMRCSAFHANPSPSLSCGERCNIPLSCGTHFCEQVCHPGKCDSCHRTELVKCHCGKEERTVSCGEGIATQSEGHISHDDGQSETWKGRFTCEQICRRPFACGEHFCEKTCHSPSSRPATCPFDPSVVKHCPCGKRPLEEFAVTTRTTCADPVPTCDSICGKQLDGCSHVCLIPCHVGPCPPCSTSVSVACRCAATSTYVPCHKRQRDIEQGKQLLLCDKVCGGLRLCGRHQCTRVCCPLAAVAKIKPGKGKKKATLDQLQFDYELASVENQWHECDLVCGKMLGCGSHRCEAKDHKGPCPPCLQSSFEELICHCGRSVLPPPVPCGTRISCTFPCDRPAPACGHEKSAHSCHEDSVPCPPCPFLTIKSCACQKVTMKNVRCSQEKVSCGQSCGKLLSCGFHRCQRLCHGDDCGACTSLCGKPRKGCLPAHHPCELPCHAPSACNENAPCVSRVTVSCPCGRLQQPAECGKCTSNPLGSDLQRPSCRDECHVAKRNAKLAEALGISQGQKDTFKVTYSDELTSFGRSNTKFVSLVEQTLNGFVQSERKTQVLPFMPHERRNFVRELCQMYRLDTQLVDQEPRRSVQLLRRIDSRIPQPLLSATLISPTPALSLGKLTDMRAGAWRAGAATTAPSPASTRSAPSNPIVKQLSWKSVAASQVQATGSEGAGSRPAVGSSTQAASSVPLRNVEEEGGVPDDWEED